MKKTSIKKKVRGKFSTWVLIRTYWIHLTFLFFLVNFVITRSLQLTFFAESCMTQAMIDSDSRCLYVYANSVYEKGTRGNPHHNNPCGSNVTQVMLSFHIANMVQYLDPNYIAPLCTALPTSTPNPTATTIPTQVPSNTPAPSNTPKSTNTPQPTVPPGNPTNTPIPTTIPTHRPTSTSTPMSTPAPTLSNLPTVTPTVGVVSVVENASGTGFGKYVAFVSLGKESLESGSTGVLSPPTVPVKQRAWTSIIFWSELLTAGSFIVLIVSVLLSGIRKMLK